MVRLAGSAHRGADVVHAVAPLARHDGSTVAGGPEQLRHPYPIRVVVQTRRYPVKLGQDRQSSRAGPSRPRDRDGLLPLTHHSPDVADAANNGLATTTIDLGTDLDDADEWAPAVKLLAQHVGKTA